MPEEKNVTDFMSDRQRWVLWTNIEHYVARRDVEGLIVFLHQVFSLDVPTLHFDSDNESIDTIT